MIIEKYIRNLLYEHDCVVIPDFGGFIAHYVSASVHPIRHTFVPPSKEIAFNEMLKLNDGVLISYVASGEGVSREEAANRVREFAEGVKNGIQHNQKYVFEEIGTLSLNVEQKLQFVPCRHINYLSESFGLPELIHKPIDRIPSIPRFRVKDRPAAPVPAISEEKPIPVKGEEPVVFRALPKSRFRRGIVYALGLPAVFGMSAIVGYLLFVENDKSLASFSPFNSWVQSIPEDEAVLDTDTSFVSATTGPNGLALAGEPEPEANSPVEEAPRALQDPEPPSMEAETNIPVAPKEEVAKAADSQKVLVKVKPEPAEVKAEKEILVKKVEPAKPAAKGDVVVSGNTVPRYYVIVGGFGVKANAFKLVKALKKQGNDQASVLWPEEKGLHKVSAADFDRPELAAAKALELKARYSSAWVFKF
jgi:hypothetical protein